MIDDILKQRQSTHGDYPSVAAVAMEIIGLIDMSQLGNAVLEYSLHQIANKIARILRGDAEHQDHWVDIQGYAKLAQRYLEEKNGK